MPKPPKMPIWLERKIRGQLLRKRRLEKAIRRAQESDNLDLVPQMNHLLARIVDDIGVHVHEALRSDGSSLTDHGAAGNKTPAAGVPVAKGNGKVDVDGRS